ncbi:MAG: ATP-binding cassette domain-containing protein [Rickettsiales bacterium]|nr:ATP-binding cassette domain-containing protein [Rickettsiales bacterium]
MLEIENISFVIEQKPIIQSLSFSLETGRKMLVLGASGSGKTTLLAMIAGLLKPSSGEVRYDNQSLHDQTTREVDHFRGQNLGIIFQNHHLIKPLTVMQNLQLGLNFTGKEVEEVRLQETLKRLNLESKVHQKASTLSMGEAQRLAVARAVIGKPKWILCDEPTSALDDVNSQAVLNLLEEEAQACDASLIIVTHDKRVKAHFSDEQVIELEAVS